MRYGYFTMPVHPADRPWHETLAEDREIVILADKLGFHDAFIGEHLTDKCENITNSMIFLASVIGQTKQIKLGTGTSNLSQMHPSLIASNAAMMDHLCQGRFIFGISAGALPSDAEVLQLLDQDRLKMFAESIDVILEIWKRDPPYDIDLPNNRFKVTTAKTHYPPLSVGIMGKPYQKPRPEIVGTVVAPGSQGVIQMGMKDFHPLSANFLMPQHLPSHWTNYAEGKSKVGATANRDEWRVARTIFVADDDNTAERYGKTDAKSPYRFYYQQLFGKLAKGGRLAGFKTSPDQPNESVTLEFVMDRLCIYGTPDKVADQILALREDIGDFGEIVYCGVDWTDARLGARSMQLLAEKVMPKVNAAIGRKAAAE
jgi:alkanesulfonate monooxygenase SsuD/methylene tetrahydromethanopterin reductase-like flavin-dependent oxidoreductase (luciferase family)